MSYCCCSAWSVSDMGAATIARLKDHLFWMTTAMLSFFLALWCACHSFQWRLSFSIFVCDLLVHPLDRSMDRFGHEGGNAYKDAMRNHAVRRGISYRRPAPVSLALNHPRRFVGSVQGVHAFLAKATNPPHELSSSFESAFIDSNHRHINPR